MRVEFDPERGIFWDADLPVDHNDLGEPLLREILPDDMVAEIDRLSLDVIQYKGGSEEVKRLLARWYFASRREGWEEGEKEEEVISGVVDYFANTISGEWPSGWDLEATINTIDGFLG